MRRIFTGLMVFVYVAMSVAAHGLSNDHRHSKTAGDTGGYALLEVNSLAGQTSNNTAGGETSECETMHCLFHFIFIAQSSSSLAFAGRHHPGFPDERQLLAQTPETSKKPPRYIS
jgi:hypothetical protein